MANKKFSELTETTSPNSASIFATAYDGDNFKVTLTNIAANMPSITTSGTVTATTFIGNVTGNVTGSVTGNASTATALATGRTIGMTGDVTWTSASFDGTGNVTGTASIGTGVIVNADVNASAAIDASKIHDGTVSNTEFGYLNGVTSAIQTQMDTKITASSSDTLTNKTFDANGTGNSLSNVEVADLASGVLDTDLSSVAATDTTLASAKAIKTYVDSQVTAQDLDFQADTGGALSIDLDSETLTFTGGTGIDTSGSGNAVTFAIDSTVATLTGSQTLTNKTLTTPVISSISNTGTLTLPTSTDTLVGRATTDTLTNKTINSASNTITITESNISDLGSYITASSTDTLTNKSGNISQWTNDSAYLTGNQTITLSGDASGSGTTAITVTVADDSHNHIISNVDGLQTALDAKLANVVEDTTPQLGGNLDVNGNKIVSTSNADIDIEPNGTGNVLLGNLKFDADQTVGAGQDNYVLTYDNSAGTISLEAASGGGISSVVEDTSPQLGGTLDANGNTIDMDGNELILDSDGDTSITADTDDRIDIRVGGTDVAYISSNSGQGALINRKTATPLIINGNMQIAQRGDQTGVTAYRYINVDRYFINMINLGTWSFTQSTDTPAGQGFGSSLKIDCTTADASPAAGDNFYLSMQSEGQNLQILEKGTSDAKTSTLAFWIKSNKTGNYVVELWDRTNDRHVAVLKTISSANTWEKHICNFPADTTGALANTSARSIMISWAFDSGSNFTSGTLPSTWASRSDANRFVGTNLGLGDNTANEVLITGVQWEVGTFDANTIPPFQFEDIGTSLARCQRYCIAYGTGEESYQQLGETGISTSTTVAQIPFNHPTEMRGVPSVTTSGNLALGQGTSLFAATSVVINTNADTRQSTGVIVTVASGLTGHRPYRLDQQGSGASRVTFDAEL